jgi:hypothetical protein
MPFAQLGIKWWQRKPRRTNLEIAIAEGLWWKCPLCGVVRVTPGGDLRCPTKSCPEYFKLVTKPEAQLARLKREGYEPVERRQP